MHRSKADDNCEYLCRAAWEDDLKADLENKWEVTTTVYRKKTEIERILFLIAAAIDSSNKPRYRKLSEFDKYGYNNQISPYLSQSTIQSQSSFKYNNNNNNNNSNILDLSMDDDNDNNNNNNSNNNNKKRDARDIIGNLKRDATKNSQSRSLYKLIQNIMNQDSSNIALKTVLKDSGMEHCLHLVEGLIDIQKHCVKENYNDISSKSSYKDTILSTIENVKNKLDDSLELIREEEDSIKNESHFSSIKKERRRQEKREKKRLEKIKRKQERRRDRKKRGKGGSGSDSSDIDLSDDDDDDEDEEDDSDSSDDDVLGIASEKEKKDKKSKLKYERLLKLRKATFLLMFGKAQLSYIDGDYEDSLLNFHKLLLKYPKGCPPYIHLGIGLCCLKLKEYDIARYSFHRAKSLVCGVCIISLF